MFDEGSLHSGCSMRISMRSALPETRTGVPSTAFSRSFTRYRVLWEMSAPTDGWTSVQTIALPELFIFQYGTGRCWPVCLLKNS